MSYFESFGDSYILQYCVQQVYRGAIKAQRANSVGYSDGRTRGRIKQFEEVSLHLEEAHS